MRKLVTIREIDDLLPIAKADRIELAIVGGWSCIVKKGEFHVGDAGLFFEIDSWLPAEDERFSFLGKTKTYMKKDGYRIRTMKMRGVISQGLLLPLNSFPELDLTLEDHADTLSVIKWDAEIANPSRSLTTGNAAGKFPSFIPKTDQPRLQNLMHYFDMYKESSFEETLKLDGSSLTAYKIKTDLPFWKTLLNKAYKFFDTSHFGVCSRNLELKRSDNFEKTFDNNGKKSTYKQSDFWKVVNKYNVEERLPEGYAIQAELIGPKIQNNHESVEELEMYIFDVWDIVAERMLNPHERRKFCELHALQHIPVVSNEVKVFSECTTFDEFQARVTGLSMNPNTISEGRVYKEVNGAFTFKLVSNDYLLKGGN